MCQDKASRPTGQHCLALRVLDACQTFDHALELYLVSSVLVNKVATPGEAQEPGVFIRFYYGPIEVLNEHKL